LDFDLLRVRFGGADAWALSGIEAISVALLLFLFLWLLFSPVMKLRNFFHEQKYKGKEEITAQSKGLFIKVRICFAIYV